MTSLGFSPGVKRSALDATTPMHAAKQLRSGPNGRAGMDSRRDAGMRQFLGPRANDPRPIAPLGGNNAQQVAGLRPWLAAGAAPPSVGTTPSFQSMARGTDGMTMFGGFGAQMQVGRGGIAPTAKAPGTSNIAWANFQGQSNVFDAMQGRSLPGLQDAAYSVTPTGAPLSTAESPFRTAPFAQMSARSEINSMGFPTNATISAHAIQKVALADLHYNTQKGQLLFMYKGSASSQPDFQADPTGPSSHMRSQTNFVDVSPNRFQQFNHVVFNFILASTEKQAQFADQVMTPAQILRDWAFGGVVISEQGDAQTSGATDGQTHNNPYSEQAKGDRILNRCMAGRVTTQNIWGAHITTGTHLWLILKKVPIEQVRASARDSPGTYLLDPSGQTTVDINQQQNRTSSHPFQVVPWASMTEDQVPLAELEYVDELGSKHFGKAIHVGVVEDFAGGIPNKYSKNETSHVPFNVAQTLLGGVVSVLVNRRPML